MWQNGQRGASSDEVSFSQRCEELTQKKTTMVVFLRNDTCVVFSVNLSSRQDGLTASEISLTCEQFAVNLPGTWIDGINLRKSLGNAVKSSERSDKLTAGRSRQWV